MYGKFTQGTVLHGVRYEQYPNVKCSAVIITARCDISQCKVSRFYYLSAMDVNTWVSSEGLIFAAERQLLSEMTKIINDFGEKVPGLKEYQNASSINLRAIIEYISSLPETKDRNAAMKRLEEIKKYSVEEYDEESRLESLSFLKEKAYGHLPEIFDDKNTQYCFVPQNAYCNSVQNPWDGLIINLHDINFFTSDVVDAIERQTIDYDKLTVEQREKYNESFFLEQTGDMIFPEEVIKSPYLEHLMQAFSFAFIRIGVDFDKKAAKDYWKDKK